MKIRNQRNTEARLESRQQQFDSWPEKVRATRKRPGSNNPTKGSATHAQHK